MKLAIVGAGICGLSAARNLAGRGHDVTLFEQFSNVHHEQGSSHGRSRIVRRAYPDPLYTQYMADAYPLWSELQSRTETPILFECGLIYFGPEQSTNMQSMIKGLKDLDVPFSIHDSSSAKSVMPQLRLKRNEIGVFTPEAGWVHAKNVLRTTYELARAAGAKFMFDHKADIRDIEKNFDAFIVCAGAWITDFVPLEVVVTKQTFCYLEGALEGPVWIEDSQSACYGFPSGYDNDGVKIGVHHGGEVIDPNVEDRQPSSESIEIIRVLAQERFGFQNPNVIESHGCLYTTTPNEDFRLGRLRSNGFFASACSGHGFKFGPWIGKLLADFVEGKDKPENYPRFSAD